MRVVELDGRVVCFGELLLREEVRKTKTKLYWEALDDNSAPSLQLRSLSFLPLN